VRQRAARAADLLRTRVDVERQAQNQRLLESMDHRADLALRLQRTVEGLSVVAISYYGVGLALYLLGPVAEMITERIDGTAGWLTFVPSRRNPALVADFAARLASHLNLPLLNLVTKTQDRQPQKLMHNSATQHANVWGAFEIVGTPPRTRGILFDDIIDSRWTVTVIGSALRLAGSGPVVPVGLASAAGLE